MIGTFGYRAGSSLLHRLGAGPKTLCLLMLQAGIFAGDSRALLPFILLMVIGYRHARLPLWSEIWQMRGLLLLALVVVITRGVSMSGTILIRLGPLTVTALGLGLGAIAALRLMLSALLTNLYIRSTSLGSIIDLVHRLLYPLHRRFAGRVALMCGLSISFYAVILLESRQISEALKVRGLSNRRHPYRATLYLTRNLLFSISQRCYRIVDALEARGYNDCRTPVASRSVERMWLPWSVGLLTLSAVLLRIRWL